MPNYDDSELSKALDRIWSHGTDTAALRSEMQRLHKSVDALEDHDSVERAERQEQFLTILDNLAVMRQELMRLRAHGRTTTEALTEISEKLWAHLKPYDRDQTEMTTDNGYGETRSDMTKILSRIGTPLSAHELGQMRPLLKATYRAGEASWLPYDGEVACRLIAEKAMTMAEAKDWKSHSIFPTKATRKDNGARVQRQLDGESRVVWSAYSHSVPAMLLPPTLLGGRR